MKFKHEEKNKTLKGINTNKHEQKFKHKHNLKRYLLNMKRPLKGET